MNKVFIIGLHKTGTSSVHKALEMMGYTMYQDELTFYPNLTEEKCIEVVENNTQNRRGFPFCAYPEILKEKYPNATFIHTLRDEEDWWRSIHKNWEYQSIPMHNWFYGTFNKDNYIQKYREHNKKVAQYATITMNIFNGDGWDKLKTLGKTPDQPFPHINKTK